MKAVETREIVKIYGGKQEIQALKDPRAMPSLLSAHQPDHFYSEELTSLPNLYLRC